MVRVQAGDPRALAALIERWRNPLYAFLWRRAGDAADDLFQESWIRVTRARDRFDQSRRFSTWLFQIANNLCRDRARRGAAALRARDAIAAAPPPAALRAAGGAADTDLRLDLARRLAALPDRLREVLVLRYYRDLGEQEIADVLAIPPGTVKSRLHAARARFERAYGEDR